MPRSFVCDLNDGDQLDHVLLIRNKQIRNNRNGNPYLQLELTDRTGSLDARYWNVTDAEAHSIESGDFVAVKGKVQLFQGQRQAIINTFRRCDPQSVDPTDFIPTTPKNIDAMLAELREALSCVRDPYLLALARAYLIDDEFMRDFARAPAGVRNHHAYIGGLLEHVLTMLKAFHRIADLYPHLDHDLMRLGIFLHDQGKIRELAYDRSFLYTDEGQLIGHVVIGVEMLNDKRLVAEELLGEPIPEELFRKLKHLIVSHHGSYEFGSPKLPMLPEAIALHHLDNFDAKIHNFAQTIQNDPNSTATWTPYDPSLGRRLYKGNPVAPPASEN